MKDDVGRATRNIRYVDYLGLVPPGGMCAGIGRVRLTNVGYPRDTFLYLVKIIVGTFTVTSHG